MSSLLSESDTAAVVGGGLVGCLLAIYLRQHGFSVNIYEGRDDPRKQESKGRSINLVITSRGIHALTSVSPALAEKVMAVTTRVEGRTLHDKSGETQYQSYGPTSAYCNFSVNRWELNRVLMDAAEEAGCAIHFKHPVAHADIPNRTLFFYLADPSTGRLYQKRVTASVIFGADGGGSRCRQALRGLLGDEAGSDESRPLGYGYKELHMPAAPGGGYPVRHTRSRLPLRCCFCCLLAFANLHCFVAPFPFTTPPCLIRLERPACTFGHVDRTL